MTLYIFLNILLENSQIQRCWWVAPNVAGQCGERRGWARGFEFPAPTPQNWLKSPVCALKGTLTFYSPRAKIAGNSNAEPHVQLPELQCKLNLQT